MQAVKDAGRALAPRQSSAAPDWLGLCPEGSVTGRIWAMRDDYRTRFAVLAECGYPGGVDPHVFLLDIDACMAVTPVDAAVFVRLGQQHRRERHRRLPQGSLAHARRGGRRRLLILGTLPARRRAGLTCDVPRGGW